MVVSWANSREPRALAANRWDQRRRVARLRGSAASGAHQQHRRVVAECRAGQLGLPAAAVPDPRDGGIQSAPRWPETMRECCARLPSWPAHTAAGRHATRRPARRSPPSMRPLSMIMPTPGTLDARPGVLQRRRGDAGVDQPQRREDPALMNAVPQQPEPNFQAGSGSTASCAGVEVLRCRGGAIGPGVGPEMAQRGQRPSRGDRLGDRSERSAGQRAAHRTAAGPRLGLVRPRRVAGDGLLVPAGQLGGGDDVGRHPDVGPVAEHRDGPAAHSSSTAPPSAST